MHEKLRPIRAARLSGTGDMATAKKKGIPKLHHAPPPGLGSHGLKSKMIELMLTGGNYCDESMTNA